MCGRATLEYSIDTLKTMLVDEFKVTQFNFNKYKPSYNIAPTNRLVGIISHKGEKRAGTLRWGLIPSFAKDKKVGNMMINARAETINEKASFRSSFQQRRCVILVSGFYEWEKHTKQPYYFKLKNNTLMPMAGIWSTYIQDEEKLHTCAIITTKANEQMSGIHHRMPVILNQVSIDQWLTKTSNTDELHSVMKPYEGDLKITPISKLVNNIRYDGPECVQSI